MQAIPGRTTNLGGKLAIWKEAVEFFLLSRGKGRSQVIFPQVDRPAPRLVIRRHQLDLSAHGISPPRMFSIHCSKPAKLLDIASVSSTPARWIYWRVVSREACPA